MSRLSPLIDVFDLSHVVSESQILNPQPPPCCAWHALFVAGCSWWRGWFRRIGKEVGSVTDFWWRRSREEWVGREGLYKASQQLWVTNTREGDPTAAANPPKSFSLSASSASTSVDFQRTDSPDWNFPLKFFLKTFTCSNFSPGCQWKWVTWMLWLFTGCLWKWRSSLISQDCPELWAVTRLDPSWGGRENSALIRSQRRWMRKDFSL